MAWYEPLGIRRRDELAQMGAIHQKKKKMKYSKTHSDASNSTDYFMLVKKDEWLKVTLYADGWAEIMDEVFGGEIETNEQDFKTAFMTASNRFRLQVFGKSNDTRTETNEGNYTEIELKPTK